MLRVWCPHGIGLKKAAPAWDLRGWVELTSKSARLVPHVS